MSSGLLSPRAYMAMTLDETARDGAGCLKRLDTECRRRAHELWKSTGETCEEKNWLAAERSLIRPTRSGGGAAGAAPGAAAKADAAAAADRSQELLAQLRERDREVSELQKIAEARKAELKKLQDALAASEAAAAAREAELKKSRDSLAAAEAAAGERERLLAERAAELEEARGALAAAQAAAARPSTADVATQWPEEAPAAAEAPEEAPEAKQKPAPAPEANGAAPPKPQGPDEETARKLKAKTDALDKEKQVALNKVLEKKQVELDKENHSLNFTKPVDFEPRHHGVTPTATFKDESTAMGVLRDAAALLAVYDTAQVVVEGHTATPDSKLDDWAHELARNRAERVKNALQDLGVSAKRLKAVGKPGKYGIGHTEVRLKIEAL